MSQSVGRYEEWTNPEGHISATIPGFAKPGKNEVYQYADLFVFSFTVHYIEDSENIIMTKLG